MVNSLVPQLGLNSNLDLRKGDYKAEIHFIGQIECGKDFAIKEELFCEAYVEIGSAWTSFGDPSNIQTHCCAPSV